MNYFNEEISQTNYNSNSKAENIFSQNYQVLSPQNNSIQDEAIDTVKTSKKKPRTHKSLRDSNNDMLDYVRSNFIADKSTLFLTLTYDAPLVNDQDRLAKDIKAFFRKLSGKIPNLTYLYVREPNFLGLKWHFHCIAKRKDGKQFKLSEEELRSLWGCGYYVYKKRVHDINGLCGYLDIFKNRKKRRRLRHYPQNLRIYGHSAGMKKKNK